MGICALFFLIDWIWWILTIANALKWHFFSKLFINRFFTDYENILIEIEFNFMIIRLCMSMYDL